MVLPLKLVSLNAYLIGKSWNHNLETNPHQRAAAIYNYVTEVGAFDLCFFQEVWGVGLNQLVPPSATPKKTVESISLTRRPISLFGTMKSPVLDWCHTLWLYVLSTGGLYDMALAPMACVYRNKYTYTKSRSKSRKGVEATLWTKIQRWEGRYDLLVLNTHLDPWHPTNRQIQVQELEDFLQQTLNSIELARPHQDWSNTGVLVVGDFNVKACVEDENHTSEEYKALFASRMSWKDLFAMKPLTAQTYAHSNSLVQFPSDCGRIDYIFAVEGVHGRTFLPLKALNPSIVKQESGEELSDHYPLTVELLPDIN